MAIMKLKEWQDWKKLNNTELAKLLGLDPTLISHWHNGRRRPNPAQALLIEQLTKGEVRKEELVWPNEH